MILDRLDLTAEEFERITGWEIKPEGVCNEGVCVPLPSLEPDVEGRIDVTVVAERLGMPIAHDEAHGLWALGPRSGDRRVLDPRDAVPHFQEAHRLDPTNWSYHREALSLVDPAWGQVYARDLLSEVEAVGVETFYPPPDM